MKDKKLTHSLLLIRIPLILAGALLIADTLFVFCISNLNLGVIIPAILGLPLLLLGLFLPGLTQASHYSLFRVLKIVLIAGYALVIAAFGVTSIIISHNAKQTVPRDLDVIIVLGASLHGETPTRILTERLLTATQYLRENPRTVAIVSGGQGSGEGVTEADAMARYLAAHGIPAARCIKEERSGSTRENFLYSYAIVQERFGEDAAIGYVTTGFHIYRAGLVAKKQGIAAYGIAARDNRYVLFNNYLRESVALWLYAGMGAI
ncbi:MAG: YdcF family protein [Clostridiales bacterium]|jgi:uncharacterized SAM-binding protein YcdF (DUF218 family)|nr:YdcF family protein [Clostridiales bacterium]